MNTLTLLIYLSGLADKLAPVLGIIGFVAVIVLAIWSMAYTENTHKVRSPLTMFKTWYAVTYFVALVFLMLIPSKSTVALMAASELGEKFVHQHTDFFTKGK